MARRKQHESQSKNHRIGSAAAKRDRKLARSARAKIRGGQQPTAREAEALARVRREREERLRWQHYGSIPRAHWLKMAGGRSSKTIVQQAARYGIPFGDDPVDLRSVVLALHDFLAANYRKLYAVDDDLDDPTAVDSPALERYREARAEKAELEVSQMRRELVGLDEVRQMIERCAAHLRRAGHQLEARYGPEAREMLEESIQEFGEQYGQELAGEAPKPTNGRQRQPR